MSPPWKSHFGHHGVSSALYVYTCNCEFRCVFQISDIPEKHMINLMIYCVSLKVKSFTKIVLKTVKHNSIKSEGKKINQLVV